MSPIAVFVLAVSMSADAFAASVGWGAALGRPRFSDALRAGAVFGIIEAITPIIGWTAGVAASGLVQAVGHWIAFALLGVVGGRMIYAARRKAEGSKPVRQSLWMLFVTAVGTSLDAMAVGVSLAFLNVNIAVIALAVGLATFVLSTGGTLIARFVCKWFGPIAEATAGLALFLIGVSILVEHL
jgi:manganese efflux pump family protein